MAAVGILCRASSRQGWRHFIPRRSPLSGAYLLALVPPLLLVGGLPPWKQYADHSKLRQLCQLFTRLGEPKEETGWASARDGDRKQKASAGTPEIVADAVTIPPCHRFNSSSNSSKGTLFSKWCRGCFRPGITSKSLRMQSPAITRGPLLAGAEQPLVASPSLRNSSDQGVRVTTTSFAACLVIWNCR